MEKSVWDYLLDEDSEKGTPSGPRMPPWTRDYERVCPHIEEAMAIFAPCYRHKVMQPYRLDLYSGPGSVPSTIYARDEFVFDTTYATWFSEIHVLFEPMDGRYWSSFCDVKKRKIIYGYCNGWRDGPWWPRFLEMLRKCRAEVDAANAADSRAEQAAKDAKTRDEADLFSAYRRRCEVGGE